MSDLRFLLGDISEEDYIYLDKYGTPQMFLDLYIHWNELEENPVLIHARKNDSLNFLRIKIVEVFEKYSSLRGLVGFQTCNLKLGNKEVPRIGKIGDFLKSGEHLTCDFTSDDLWIDVEVNCMEYELAIYFEVKIRKQASIEVLHRECFECTLTILEALNRCDRFVEHNFMIQKVDSTTWNEQTGVSNSLSEMKIHLMPLSDLNLQSTIEESFEYLSRSVLGTLISKHTHDLPKLVWRNSLDNFEGLALPFTIRGLHVEKKTVFEKNEYLKQMKEDGGKPCLECNLF